MDEELKPEFINLQEKSSEQIHKEWKQAYDEMMKLSDQTHKLLMKAGEDGISKEQFNSIVGEYDKLNVQFDEKWEAIEQLEEQGRKAEEKEMRKIDEEWKAEKEKMKAEDEEWEKLKAEWEAK